jgi:hypothetical protein
MPKTVIEKSQSPSPDVTVFSVSGTLGFHEKDTLAKLFDECKRRNLTRIVIDVGKLTSLGGGCAKIIRSVAESGEVAIGIAGAKPTVLKFLGDDGQLVVSDSVEDAVSKLAKVTVQPPGRGQARETRETRQASKASKASGTSATTTAVEESPDESSAAPPSNEGVIILGLDPIEPTEETAEATRRESPGERPRANQPAAGTSTGQGQASGEADPRELQKRIVQYNTLFSLNSEFYRIQGRKNLLDLFLLTTIAQVGVESATFLELHDGYFIPVAVKGLDADELKGFAIPAAQMKLSQWKETLQVYTVESAPFSDEVKAQLLSLGCSYVAPFVAHNEFRGILALGKPIKSGLDEGSAGFLGILVNQAAIAYESTQRFEEEKERTMGLVQTLISLIEENTLARGNTQLVSSYTYTLAKKVNYPEEHVRDLMYGTMLRDIGMIKVSDLIVRSPRELMPEEWEIIKRHPIDGAEMLRKMRFSEHAISVVLAHHERFNGEGYPHRLQGKQITLGSRIVSVVESYAAMLQERPTRPALTQVEALNTLRENWGMRYDPDIVKAFVEIVEEELRTGRRSQEAQFELFSV